MNGRTSRSRLRIAVFGALLLVANGAAFAAFTWPRLTRVRRAESRARDVSARRAALERVWSQVQARKELLNQNRKDIETLNRDHLKYRSEDLFAAQREIEKLARDAGLKPKKSTYSLVRIKGTDLVRCEVTLPLDGSYSNLTGLLARIQSAKRFIVVDQMALAQDEEQAGARMNLKLSAVFKEGSPLAAR